MQMWQSQPALNKAGHGRQHGDAAVWIQTLTALAGWPTEQRQIGVQYRIASVDVPRGWYKLALVVIRYPPITTPALPVTPILHS